MGDTTKMGDTTLKFRLGDKVKVSTRSRGYRKDIGKIGTITMVDRIKEGYSTYWDYEVTFDNGYRYAFSPEEIEEIIATKGQLLFDFMI